MKRLDGKEVSQVIREGIKADTAAFVATHGYAPGLAVIVVGDDSASHVYVRNKKRACEEVGFLSRVYERPSDTTEEELLALIAALNEDAAIHGILVQLPLPQHIRESLIIAAIDPKKDVDAFHPIHAGGLLSGVPALLPCTPAGIMEILHYYGISPRGKRCVVVGRSAIVGKPIALLLLAEDATVTICHSKTQDLASVTREADILVVAIGRPRFIGADMVKAGAVVIDVGVNRTPDGKLCGDVDAEAVSGVVFALTPVPGGVGPMTITMLLKNTLAAAEGLAVGERKFL